jgi:putative transcriptional regulator
MGLVINKQIPVLLNDLMVDFSEAEDIPLYRGGPVSTDTLFYLHTLSDTAGAIPVGNGLYMNGDFDAIKKYILNGNPITQHIRFFLGYSGWTGKQLSEEIKENTWLISEARRSYLMDDTHAADMWKRAMQEMGSKYVAWSRFPQVPILN